MTDWRESPSQTAGPYLHIGLGPDWLGIGGEDLGAAAITDGRAGAIRIEGCIYDGEGAPVRDAMLEFWQADSHGTYAGQGFQGWARRFADFETGAWALETIRPGAVSQPDGPALAPYITVWITARGLNRGLWTRILFPDAGENAACPVLAAVPADRAQTLMAQPTGPGHYRFDIHLQGPHETVFFETRED